MSDKTPDILIYALRQYQHNDCSGFVAGFDYAETVTVVKSLEAQRDELLAASLATIKMWDDIYPDMTHRKYPQDRLEDAEFQEIAKLRAAIAKCEAQS